MVHLLANFTAIAALRRGAESHCAEAMQTGNMRCRVLLYHVHKCGGSTLCALAFRNGHAVDLRGNCQGNRQWWSKTEGGKSDFLSATVHDFVATEDQPFVAPPLPGAPSLFIISLRNPLDRILSHFRHHRRDRKLTNFSFASFAVRGGVERGEADYWACNFYVQLLGATPSSSCFGRGARCGEDELDISMRRLAAYFSVVLIADSPAHFRVGGQLLRRRLGWSVWDTDENRRGTDVASSAVDELKDHRDAYNRLVVSNLLDMRLYEHAKTLFEQQILSLLVEDLSSAEQTTYSSPISKPNFIDATELLRLSIP